jgi:hypothetical protein
MAGHKLEVPDDIDVQRIVAIDNTLSVRVSAKNFKAQDAMVALATEEQLINLCTILNSTKAKDDGALVCLEKHFALTPKHCTTLIPVPQGVWYAVCFTKHADFSLQTVVAQIDEQ